jgi:hypothetical protein
MSKKNSCGIAKNILAMNQFRMLENMSIDCHGTTCLAMTKAQLLQYFTLHNDGFSYQCDMSCYQGNIHYRHCEKRTRDEAIHTRITNQKDSA